jgi:diguanylate cyclase
MEDLTRKSFLKYSLIFVDTADEVPPVMYLPAENLQPKAPEHRYLRVPLALIWVMAAGKFAGMVTPTLSTHLPNRITILMTIPSIVVIMLRPGRVARERWAWGLLAAASLVNFLGDVLWEVLGGPAGVSAADSLYLLYYPFAYVGLLLLARFRTHDRSVAPWLDGITSGLSALAVVAALVQHQIITSPKQIPTLAVMIQWSYPVCDVILLALVLAALGRGRWRGDRAFLVVCLSLIVSAGVDTLYVSTVADSQIGEQLLTSGWLLGQTLMAAAAWVRAESPKGQAATADRHAPRTFSMVPLLGSAVSIMLLCIGHWTPLPDIAVMLATASLFSALARLLLANHDLGALVTTRRQARTDELTLIANRRSLIERVDEMVASGVSGSLLLIDLDGFKEVNDSLGHSAGDHLLVQVAERLVAVAADHHLVARLGGDEFAIVLPGADATESMAVANRLHEALDVPVELDGIQIRMNGSVGCTSFPRDASSTSDLMRCADIAMYTAKRAGRPTCQFDPETDPHGREQLVALDELHRAIDTKEFVLHYQPKVRLCDGSLVGFEALVRWDHPERGLLLPDSFMSLVERSNLMPVLTRKVLREAIFDTAMWVVNGVHPSVSVNVSASDLLDERFAQMVRTLLAETGFSPDRLIIEITEGTLISDPQRAGRAIDRLREVGVRISLDDFGMGFSSLSQLAYLTLDELKLDRSIVADVLTSSRARAIVEATAGLARSLQLVLVVEGIEDEPTRALLAELGCELAQGYLFAKPMPASIAQDWAMATRSTRPVESGLAESGPLAVEALVAKG